CVSDRHPTLVLQPGPTLGATRLSARPCQSPPSGQRFHRLPLGPAATCAYRSTIASPPFAPQPPKSRTVRRSTPAMTRREANVCRSVLPDPAALPPPPTPGSDGSPFGSRGRPVGCRDGAGYAPGRYTRKLGSCVDPDDFTDDCSSEFRRVRNAHS